MALTQGGLDDARHNGGYLSAACRARAAEALCSVHAVHYAGRVQKLHRGLVVGGDAAQVADGVVADLRHILLAYGFREHIRKVVAIYALAEIVKGRSCRRQKLARLAVSIIRCVPGLVGLWIGYEVIVIRGVDTRGDGYRLGPADVVVGAEGLVSASDHDALVVCGPDAGVVPVKRAYVGEGAAVHLSDVVENSEPLAGDRVCQRADGRDGKKAAYNEHKRQRSAIFFHMVKPPGKLGYNSVSTIISGYIIFCNRNLTIILYS